MQIHWHLLSNILYRYNYTDIKKKKTEKKRGKKRGKRSRPFGTTCQTQEIPVREGQPATLRLQASLSPGGWRIGLLMVKGDTSWTSCVSTCASSHSSCQFTAAQEQNSQLRALSNNRKALFCGRKAELPRDYVWSLMCIKTKADIWSWGEATWWFRSLFNDISITWSKPPPDFKCKLSRRWFTFLMTLWRASCRVHVFAEAADFIKNGCYPSCLRSSIWAWKTFWGCIFLPPSRNL